MRALLPICLVGVLISGCGSTSPSSAASSAQVKKAFVLEKSERMVKAGKTGLELAIPKDWVVIDAQSEAFKKVVKDELADKPDLAQVAQNVAASGLDFCAMDLSLKDKKFADNVNLVVKPGAPSREPAEKDLDEIKKQFEQIPMMKVDSAVLVDTQAGRAIHYVGELTMGSGAAQQKNISSGYIWSKDGKSYTLTVSGAGSRKAATIGIAERMAESATFK